MKSHFVYTCIVEIAMFANWKKHWLILYSITYWVFIKDISGGWGWGLSKNQLVRIIIADVNNILEL